jgi:hypothetical protein
MSCWVVPAVAAEYWGVTVAVVWERIYNDLVPHKTERGFVFVDVDPWQPNCDGFVIHQPPATYVPAEVVWAPQPVTSDSLLRDTLIELDDELLAGDSLSDDEEALLDEDELPELDEEESATFGRLSWDEVRQTVARTRRPPPRAA